MSTLSREHDGVDISPPHRSTPITVPYTDYSWFHGRWSLRAASRRAVLAGLSMAQVGCGAGWRRVPDPAVTPLKPRQQVQVWRGRESLRLHGVTIDSGRVAGIPYFKPLDCDSCRLDIPRAEVDSIRIGSPTAGFWKSVGLVMAGAVVGIVVLCASSKSCQLEAD